MVRDIPARPTGIYKSKLEKAWASFFVDYGIPFIYEPQRVGNWRPDFLLTDSKILIETKPSREIADEEIAPKINSMLKAAKKHDVVVIVAPPDVDNCGFITNIYMFAEGSRWGFDPPLLVKLTEIGIPQFVTCTVCHHYFLIGWGSYQCRCCGSYDGDHLIITALFKPTQESSV